MFNPFRKKDEEGNNTMAIGMVIGLAVAIIIIAVALFLVFKGQKGGNNGNPAGSTAATPVNLSFTIINQKDCTDCFDVNLLVDSLKNAPQSPIKVTSVVTLDASDAKAKDLIKKYQITKIPTLIATGAIDKNAELSAFFLQIGTVDNGVFVLRQVVPPYIDVASGQLKGKLALTYLVDATCKNCLDITLQDQALQSAGIFIKDQKTVDVSSTEGKAIVAKYKITKVPTILIGGQTADYPGFDTNWINFGTIAADGTHIFTKVELMGGPYRDLTTNKIVTPPASTSTAPVTTPAQ